jgi:outer membrane murein-binding lipoprotein Lpp
MKTLPSILVLATAVALSAVPAGAAPPAKQQIAQLKRQVAALKTKVARLQQENAQLEDFGTRAIRRELALRSRLAAVDPCAITRPNGSPPPGDTFGSEFHGNGSLWVGLPPSNITVDEPDANGAISSKFGWWRGATGTLRIEGRRLDGPATPLRANIPDGYGDSGFQSTSITFPAQGCWEVTGRVGDATLTFVTLALAA